MPQGFSERLEEGIAQIAYLLPQLLLALGILMAGVPIARMVEKGAEAFLRRIGFDRWMQEGGVTEALERTGSRLRPSTVIAKLIFWAVMLLVILLVANALGLVIVSSLFAELLAYLMNVGAAVIIVVIGLVLGEFVKDLVLASAGAVHGVPTLARAAKAAVIVLAVFMALEQLQIAEDIVLVAFAAVMIAGALATGIAFGLGGRDVAAEVVREWYERSRIRRSAAQDGENRDLFDEEPSPPEAPPGTGAAER